MGKFCPVDVTRQSNADSVVVVELEFDDLLSSKPWCATCRVGRGRCANGGSMKTHSMCKKNTHLSIVKTRSVVHSSFSIQFERIVSIAWFQLHIDVAGVWSLLAHMLHWYLYQSQKIKSTNTGKSLIGFKYSVWILELPSLSTSGMPLRGETQTVWSWGPELRLSVWGLHHIFWSSEAKFRHSHRQSRRSLLSTKSPTVA